MKKSLIIFDLDGTLIDSVPDLTDGVDKMLAHFGKSPAGMKRVRNWVGNGSVTLVERALIWANLPLDGITPRPRAIFDRICHMSKQNGRV